SGRDAHGQRQRRTGVLGGGRQARHDSVRDRRLTRNGRPRLPRPSRLQDAVPLPLCGAPAERVVGEIMKSAEYRGMSDEQLELTRREVVKNLFHLRFQSATERLETPSEIRKAKRELARIMTIQRERELKAEKTSTAPRT